MVFNRSNAVARRGIIAALLTVSACGDNPVEPLPEVASIIVSSPIDTVFALGGSASLVATAKTATGDPIQVQFTWRSSNEAVVRVSAAGVAEAVGSGNALITAENGTRTGQLRLRVVETDLTVVRAVTDDPLRDHLMAGMSSGMKSAIQAAIGAAGSSAATGNVLALRDAYQTIGKAADDATDPTDRALLAVLRLFIDHAIRLLNL